MDKYFGNFITTASTLMLLVAFIYMAYTMRNHKNIENWGRRIAFLASFGLILCCFVATRDNYHRSVQASFDTSVTPGIFTIASIQSTLCCIGGAVIAFSTISSIFVKNQKYRKIMFFVLSTSIVVKTLIIEISRWVI